MTTANFKFKRAEIGVFQQESADRATEGFAQGCHIMGLTMGQFSLIDMIHSVLKKTGPADLYIATWSAGIKDAHQVRWMLDTDLVRGVRLLTDHSYVNRQSKYAMAIEDLFGRENIRTSEMHAKFVVIKNERFSVTILSSMNLNANRTCETFTIYEDAAICNFYLSFVMHHFDNMRDGWERSSSVVRECVEGFFAKQATSATLTPRAQYAQRHWSEV
jgi:hypothetical protein